jgi:hypothetical protein
VLLWMVACGMAGGLVSDCAADPGPLGCQANSDAAALLTRDLKSKGEQAPMVPAGELTQNALGIHTHTHTNVCVYIHTYIYLYETRVNVYVHRDGDDFRCTDFLQRGRNLVPFYRRPGALAAEHSVPLLDAGNDFSKVLCVSTWYRKCTRAPLVHVNVLGHSEKSDFSECVPGRRGCAVHLY